MIIYKVIIGGIDYTYAVPLPFKEQFVLDESLDNAVLNLKMIDKAERFNILSLVEITKNDGTTTTTYNFIVAKDTLTEIIGTGLYDHELILIEETKLLEKKIVDTNTVTNVLSHDYLAGASNVFYTNSGNLEIIKNYINPIAKGISLIIYYPGSIFDIPDGLQITYSATTIVTKDGIEIYNQADNGTFVPTGARTSFTTTSANYVISYTLNVTVGFIAYSGAVSYSVYSISQEEPPQYYTITDVVNKLLAITKTERIDTNPQFIFNSEQATKYSSVLAPEFAFTKSTLKECLDQIGGYIHAIPRLSGRVLYFDELGTNETTLLPYEYVSHQENQDIEQYCSTIDTNIDNLINIDNANDGTITEPFNNGYETVRTETTGVRITDDSAIIETEYPIEKILKVEVGYLSDGTLVGDITPYIYENAEYQALSGTMGNYPYSKAYAIYYTQGEKNLQGLNFKLPNPISSVFSDPAIINIIERKTNNPNIQNLFNVQEFVGLAFRITYFPVINTRIKQYKSNILLGEFPEEITNIYNQSANKVDSTAYGENLKGAVARLGNVEKVKTYIIPKLADLPQIGMLVDEDYYISSISTENLPDFIKCTVALSKDFNRLNKFIGIKNNLRMYEVSEKQSVERYVIYEDFCVIGNSLATNDRGLLTDNALALIVNDFNGINAKTPISVVNAIGIDTDDNELTSIALPIVNLGIGNSLWFGFRYADNYSAGNTSSLGTASTGVDYYRVQNFVPYGDFWGRIEYLKLNMYVNFGDIITNYTTQQDIGNNLPIFNETIITNSLISTSTSPIILKKDSRENINFSYQLHFISNRNNFIIGSGLALNNGLVSEGTNYAKLYVLPNKLNKFVKTVDLTGATLIKSYENDTTSIVQTGQNIAFTDEISTVDGLSWAVVNSENNQLLFGQNIVIKENDTIDMPTMTFTHIYGEL